MVSTLLFLLGFALQLLVTVNAFAIGSLETATTTDARAEYPNWESQLVGDPNRGTAFDDYHFVSAQNGHLRIREIALAGCEAIDTHLTMIGVRFKDWHHDGSAGNQGIIHGKGTHDQELQTLALRKDEHITSVEMTTWRKKVKKEHRLRLGWIKMSTNQGRTVECGSKYKNGQTCPSSSCSATDALDPIITVSKQGHALLYLKGTSGDAIDSLQAYFVDTAIY